MACICLTLQSLPPSHPNSSNAKQIRPSNERGMILTYRALTTLENLYVTNVSASVFAVRRLCCKKKKDDNKTFQLLITVT